MKNKRSASPAAKAAPSCAYENGRALISSYAAKNCAWNKSARNLSEIRRVRQVSSGSRARSASSRASLRIATLVLRDEFSRRRIAPSRRQRPQHARLLRGFQAHVRSAAASPRPRHRRKHFRFGAHEIRLLVRKQFHHPHAHVRITKRREDLSADAKIRTWAWGW